MTENPTPFLRATIRHHLDNFDLDLQLALTHSWTWLYGPTGSGKTALLRILSGLIRPHSARIHLGSQLLTDSIERTHVATHLRGIGMVTQAPHLFPHLTVVQNIRFALTEQSRLAGKEMPGAFDDAGKIGVLLERFHIAAFAQKKPAALNGQQRQLAALARAVAAPSKFILLDEPLSGFDPKLREELMSSLYTLLARRGIPVFAATRDLAEVFSNRAETLLLKAGKITAQGTPENILAAERTTLLNHLKTT